MTDEEIRRQKARAYVRKNRYGITEDQYNALLIEQDNACAVCEVKFSETVRANVDHDHTCCPRTKSCGKCLRGLLCSNCLTLASLMETRVNRYMSDMFEYLAHHLTNGGRNT